MDIIEKKGLKTKALVIILIATLMVAMSTLFCTVKAADEDLKEAIMHIVEKYPDGANVEEIGNGQKYDLNEDGKINELDLELANVEKTEPVEPKLNTKIEFTGNTYKYPNQDKVRKPYEEGEVGCGIVSIISKNAKHPVYVTGEGWINIDQIVKSEKFIDLNFDNIKDGELKLTVNGEFTNVESTNKAVINYENGILKIVGDGKTDVIITTKEGEQINALATVVNGELELSIPDKALAGELSATAVIADKITVEANGDGGAVLVIDENGIGIEGEANGGVVLKAEDKEIASATGTVTGNITGNANGVTASASGEQTMTLLQKLTLRLKERAGAKIDKEHVEVSAGGDVGVNDQEIASADGNLSYTYGEEDPTGSAKVEVLEKEVVNIENRTIKIISTLKNLITKIKAR